MSDSKQRKEICDCLNNNGQTRQFCFLKDRFRTCVNVMGDALGAERVDHLSRDDIKFADQLDTNEETPLKRNGGALEEEEDEEDDPMKMTSV